MNTVPQPKIPFTQKQAQWIQYFEDETGFTIQHEAAFENGKITFLEFATKNALFLNENSHALVKKLMEVMPDEEISK